tara:strand:+ start:927 stop:1763 length:837 start_codon:yes stop_codon:yes gene_type:complete
MGRTGAVPQAEAPTPETTSVQSPMHFVAPTEFVDLPSKGLGYDSSHPMHGQDTIEIRYMTAKDEDILTSKTLLKKGIAIERLLDNIIVNKNFKASSLLVGDRNAIIIAARISGYGADYVTRVSCPACGDTSDFNFDLTNTKTHETTLDENLGVSQTPEGNFKVTMPLSKYEVHFKLLKGKDEIYLSQLSTNKAKGKLLESALTDQYKRMIVSVAGYTEQEVINQFVNNLPTRDSRFLRSCYKAVNPDVKVIDDYSCTACGFEQELEVPFGADFFWPDR